jgi:hypothetical protein
MRCVQGLETLESVGLVLNVGYNSNLRSLKVSCCMLRAGAL